MPKNNNKIFHTYSIKDNTWQWVTLWEKAERGLTQAKAQIEDHPLVVCEDGSEWMHYA